MVSERFLQLVRFLRVNGITVDQVQAETSPFDPVPVPIGTVVWNFNSKAKSRMLVVEVDEGIKIFGRYDFEAFIQYNSNFDIFIDNILEVFRDDIMFYPYRDYACSRWITLMKQRVEV